MARIVEPTRRAWPGAIGGAVVGLMALVMQVAQAQDSLAAPTQDSNAVVDARPPESAALAKPPEAERISIRERPPRTEVEFLARYGTSDSARALIKWWFRQRALGVLLTGAGAISAGVGAVDYIAYAGENVADAFGNTVTLGLIPREQAAINGTTHVLFFGGLAALVAGGNLIARHKRMRLKYVLENRQRLTPSQWRRILPRRTPKADSVTPQGDAPVTTAPTTAEEAQRLQEEYWRQRGGVPKRKPNQQMP